MDDVQSLIEELRFGAENGADAELLERAADKIQELVADLGDADAMTEYWMKKNKWIRCDDRLPERADEVLIAYLEEYDDWTEEYAVSTATYMPRAGRWDYDHLKITHWMPLPDAPEVDG